MQSRGKMKNWKKQLVEKLREKAAELPPDTRFYSIRNLMQEYHTSQRTIEEAMQVLFEEKVLLHRAGNGYFIRGNPASRPFHIRLYYPQWPSVLYQNMERACTTYAKSKGFVFSSQAIEQSEEFFEGVSSDDCDALLLLPPSEPISRRGVQIINRLSVPAVVLGREVGDIGLSMLSDDGYSAGAMAAAYFINHGHRKLAVLISEPHCYCTEMRCQGFREFARLNGVSVKVIETGVQSWDDGVRYAYDALTKTLKADGLDFSALFLINSNSALEVYKAFADAGCSIPGDVSIIGHDELPTNEFLHPALTCVAIDWSGAIGACVEQLREVAEGKKEFFHQRISPELIVRQSVADYGNKRNSN